MNKRLLSILIGLICISLSGIIVVQFFWIRNAIEVRQSQFDRSVNDAMGMAINAIETRDNVCYIGNSCIRDSVRDVFRVLADDSLLMVDHRLDSLIHNEEDPDHQPPPGPQQVFAYQAYFDGKAMNKRKLIDTVIANFSTRFQITTGEENNLLMKWNDNELHRLDSIFNEQQISITDEIVDVQTGKQSSGNSNLIVRYSVNPVIIHPPGPPLPGHHPPGSRYDQVKKLNKKVVKMQNIIKKMTLEMESRPRPIEERINKAEIGNLLTRAFADKDIRQPFEFAVTTTKKGQPVMPVSSDGFQPQHLDTKYKVSLFPNDVFEKQIMLLVHFPRQAASILKSMSWLMIASILFTFVIILTSGMSIFVMIRQKKISDIKTDFINNMTHEFKTPIATISIAVDSINNPKVIAQPDVIKNYTRVIKEENNRMNTRVEQVLQMALLDSSEFRLSRKVINMHDLIKKVSDSIRLQTENRNGQLNLHLEASKSNVLGDESHLTNVVLSLLDNAIKYSPDHPDILITTKNSSTSIIIGVEDKGIGMNTDTQKKIFDKFFRVTSGNIHNIKGFGLGLSYAKAIVLAHHGEIRIQSETGK